LLLCAQPIAGSESELLHSFGAANPRAANSGLSKPASAASFSEAPHGCKLLVDGGGGQVPRFQVHTIVNDDDAIEGQPRLGTVPSNELIDGVLVNTARRR
jgi:hypothetical protein